MKVINSYKFDILKKVWLSKDQFLSTEEMTKMLNHCCKHHDVPDEEQPSRQVDENVIPPITDPFGESWRQPDRAKILIDRDVAVMSEESFEQLFNYETSVPTGVYVGKMWRRGRILCWYDLSDKGKKFCSTKIKRIITYAV